MSAEIIRISKSSIKFQDLVKSFPQMLIGRIIERGGLMNHRKMGLLKLFNSHEECFIKFGRTNDYILNKLLQISKLYIKFF